MANEDKAPEAATKVNIPVLAGWLSLPVAAEMTGLSRQHLHRQVSKGAGALQNVRQVRGVGDRPAAILVREAEVQRLIRERAADAGCPECRKVAAAAGQPVDVTKMLCDHGPVAVALDEELTDALGMAGL